MMQPFTFHTPTKISFGEDTIFGIGDSLVTLGGTKPLVVTDSNLVKAGVTVPVMDALKEAGLSLPVVFDQVPADSDIDIVRKAASLARSNGCDCVIAVGGGSVIDTGKVANIGLTFEGDVLDYEGMNTLSSKLLPMIAVPTTAGTGSEVSAVAVIKDHREHKKLLFGSRFLFPDAAILDPKLILSLPPKLTAATGIDALTHAIESYIATTNNCPSDALCLEAMRLIFANLPTATKNGGDLDARSATLVGSMIAGVAFTNAGVGIVHALAHSVGAKYGTHHGLTNGVFLIPGMQFNMPAAADRFADAYIVLSGIFRKNGEPLSSWFDRKIAAAGDTEANANGLIKAVRHLIDDCKLPTRLRDLGVPSLSEEEIHEVAEMALTDPAIMFNPNPASTEDLIAIIKGAY